MVRRWAVGGLLTVSLLASPDFPLTVEQIYAFRSHHCGLPGQNLVCGEIWYGGAWAKLGQWATMRCTNSDNSASCRVENLAEVYTDYSTHPTFGGGGMQWQTGMLKTGPGTWDLWETVFGTPNVHSDQPYVISWGPNNTRYYEFKACKDQC